MKKTLLFTLYLFLIVFESKAQIAYYDAVDLVKKNCVVNGKIPWNNQDALDILVKYTEGGHAADVLEEFKINPFIQIDSSGMNIQGLGEVDPQTLLPSGLGGLNVTKYAKVVVSLMIDRAKQELTVAFFERMKTFSKKNPEFKVLFPTTFDKLENLLSFAYPQMLPTLRQAFFEDIQNMNYSLEAVLLLPKYSDVVGSNPEILIAIKMLNLMQTLERGELAAVEVLDKIDEEILMHIDDRSSVGLKNLKATVQFANLFSKSLRSQTADQMWVSFDEAFEIGKINLSDSVVLKIYLGLLWQQAKKFEIKFEYKKGAPISVQDMLAENADNIFLFQNQLKQFLTIGDKVQITYNKIKVKNKGNEKNSPEDIYDYINESVDVVDFSLGLIKIFNDNLDYLEYISLVKGANDLFKAIYSEKYTIAMNSAFDLLKDIQELSNRKGATNEIAKFSKKVEPYALFMANVTDAESESDIKSALDNAILPVGSSSIKKNTSLNISIQSYLGAYYSIKNENSNVVRAWSDEAGIYGPIGISVTPGCLSWGKKGSLSAFVSVFDLGAIIDYQLKEDPTVVNDMEDPDQEGYTKDYTVNLGQIISPGFHVVYGFFSNIPLSIGVGAQYGPGLSKIDNEGFASVTNPSWRVNAFLAVDMPFFNLFNKRK